MKKILSWLKNEKVTIRTLTCHVDRKYIEASCTALLQVDKRGNRSVHHSGLPYPYHDELPNTVEYKRIIFPWLNGCTFDLDGKRIIPLVQDINEDDL